MIEGLIGKKVGMTELFLEDGNIVVATVVRAGPCYVVDKKTVVKNGYNAIQLGFEEVKPQRLTKPLLGHYKKAGIPPLECLMEFKGKVDNFSVGDVVESGIFKEGDIIDVTGMSKGKGFSGVMKRHGFSGQPDSHGGMSHRKPGSIGQASYPSRVWKGMKMPGQMGYKRVTVQGLKVVKVEPERNIVIIEGSVPGPNGSTIILKHTTKGRQESATV